MMKNKWKKTNIQSSHRRFIGTKFKVILTILLILFAVITIKLVNGNIQKLGLLNNQDAKKAETKQTTGENISGKFNNISNTLLDSYQITYFKGIDAEYLTPEDANKIKEAGFTVVTIMPEASLDGSHWQSNYINNVMGKALRILDSAGLKAIVADYRIRDTADSYFSDNNENKNEDEAKRVLREAVSFYSYYPNVIGYSVADEPIYNGVMDVGAVVKVINYLNEIDPQRPCFLNMLPYPFDEFTRNMFINNFGITDFDKYLNDVAESKSPYLSIDPYPLYLKRGGASPHIYYYDLSRTANFNYNYRKGTFGIYKNLITNSIDVITNHSGYDVYKQDIEYQVSSSLAFGNKMTVYFTYSAWSDADGNYTGMLDFDKEPTTKYNYIKDINVWTKNIGNELFNKDVRAAYLYDGQNSANYKNVTTYVNLENKLSQVGTIRAVEVTNSNGTAETTNDSHAIVSVFDDNTIMIVNADAPYASQSEAEGYINNDNRKRGKYVFSNSDFSLSNAKYFDSIEGTWKDISRDEYIENMGLYICKSQNYIVLEQGKNVLLRNNLKAKSNNYTITSSKYKVDTNKKYIYTGTQAFSESNVTKSGASISYKTINGQNILHIETTDTNHFDNIPVITLSFKSGSGYTVTGESTSDGTGGTIIVDDTIDMSKVSVTNGYAVYDPTITSDNFKVYSNNGALVDTKTVKQTNPVTVTGKTNLTYSGSAQTLATTSNAQGEVFYSTSTQLTASNYNTSGNKTIPTGTNAETYTIYWYTPENSTYAEKSGTATAKIGKATPTITLSPTSGTVDEGKTTTFTTSITSGAGSLKDPTSSSTSIATASKSGNTITVKGVSAGTATITVSYDANTNYNSKSATYSVTVKNATKPTPSIIFTDASSNPITSGETFLDGNAVKIYVATEAGSFNVTPSDTTKATVSTTSSGEVSIMPLAVGTVTITAKTVETSTYASASATYTLTIKKPNAALNFKDTNNNTVNSGEITMNETAVLTVSRPGGLDYSISLSDNTKATTSINGSKVTITPKATGTVKITAKTEETDNYAATTATYTLTIKSGVKPKPLLYFDDINDNVVTEGETNFGQKTRVWVHSPSGVEFNVVSLDTSKATIGAINITCVEIIPKAVGTVQIKATTEENEDYSSTSAIYTLTITPKSLSSTTITLSDSSFTYNGSAQTPTVTVKDGSTTLTKDTDYTLAITGNTNVGTATVTVTGKGNYTGTNSATFTIGKKTLAVTAKAASKTYGAANPSLEYTYSGQVSGQTPGFTGGLKTTATQSSAVGQYDITNNNLALADNGSFKASNYNMTFTGAKLTITAKSVSSLTVTLPSESYTYTGGEIKPEPTVKDGSTTLTKGTDYTVSYSNYTNVGTATVTITGKGNYTGTKDKTFSIVQLDLSNATITLNKESFEYNGSAQTPTITVKIGNTTLTNNTDYTVAVSGNTNVGTATITVTGKGIYSGSKTKTYTITKKTLAVTAEAKTKEYGAALPTLTYKYSGQVSNQTPGFTGNLTTTAKVESNVGEYDITKGDLALADNGTFKASNYSMSFTGAKLTVSGKTISNANITLADTSNYTYDGSAKTPTVTVKDGNTTLTKDTDYTVSYSDNTNAGTATVTVSGKGNYGGTKTATFTIKVKAITPTVTLNKTSFTYNGTAQSPTVTVKDGNTTLENNKDYTVAITKNTNVGTADVVVTLKGNYSGNKTEHFAITKRTLTVTADAKTKKYGEENPSLTYKYSGQVEEQTPGFTGKLTTTANNQSNVGEYDITQGTIAIKDNSNFLVSNYELNFVKGKLTIIKADGKLKLSKDDDINLVINCSKNIEFAASGKVTVVSSKENIVTANVSNGNILITGVAVGKAQITITSSATNNYEQTTKTINVSVVPIAVERIEIKKLPKTSYIEGQNLDVTNGKLRTIYNNNTEAEVDITPNIVTGYNKNKIGQQTLTVTYNGLVTEYTVVVRAKQVTNIEMKYNPNKQEFIQNYDDLDLTGAKIKVYYDNGTDEEINITSNMVTGYDNTKVGKNTLTVTYEEKQCTFDVQIVEKHVTEIEIIKLPNKLEYVQDYGMLDVTGGKIRVYFDDETETEMNINTKMISGFNNKVLGAQTLIVTFSGKTAAYEIEVIDKVITKIEMKELPVKTKYIKNYDELDISGAKLQLTFNDSYTNEINVVPEMVSGFDNTKVGTKTITVKYAEKETTFEVEIVEHSVSKIEIFKMPNKIEYKMGEKIDLTGGKLKLLYNDEKSEIVDMKNDMLEISEILSNTGRKLITLSAYEQEVDFEINVIEDKIEENNYSDDNGNNNNNSNNDSNYNSNNTSIDNTTAKSIIPQTGIQSGIIIIGAITFTLSAGLAVIKMFKQRHIK